MEYKKVKHKPKKKSFLSKINRKKIIIWTPRVLAILYIIFITIFAFDESVISLPFIVHLMPTILLALVLIFTWRKPLTAAIIFLILGFGFTLIFRTYQNLVTFLIISLPLILMGVLFLLEKLLVKRKYQEHKKLRDDRRQKLLMKK